MSRYTTVTAIIINKKKTKEQDIFVTLLTSHRGKITALAKGSQSIKSSRLSALQLGNISKLHLYQKNDFSWVSQATTITPFLKQKKVWPNSASSSIFWKLLTMSPSKTSILTIFLPFAKTC